MREWLVIESSTKRAVFGDANKPDHYIPRDVAEKLLGRDLGGIVWFTREESDLMRAHPEWRDADPPNRSLWQRLLAAFSGDRAPAVRPDRDATTADGNSSRDEREGAAA